MCREVEFRRKKAGDGFPKCIPEGETIPLKDKKKNNTIISKNKRGESLEELEEKYKQAKAEYENMLIKLIKKLLPADVKEIIFSYYDPPAAYADIFLVTSRGEIQLSENSKLFKLLNKADEIFGEKLDKLLGVKITPVI